MRCAIASQQSMQCNLPVLCMLRLDQELIPWQKVIIDKAKLLDGLFISYNQCPHSFQMQLQVL